MRIALEETYAPVAEPRLKEHELVYFATRSDSHDKVLDLVRAAEIMVMRWPMTFPVDRSFLEACKSLRYIHKSGSALEHPDVVDMAAVTDLGILYANNVGINADTVSEYALLLTLLCLRPNVVNQIGEMRKGVWNQDSPPDQAKARTLSGKTVGIVGLGHIGTALAIRYRAMGVSRILGYQRTQRFEHAAYGGLEWASLHELLAASDVVALCLPIDASTAGLIGARELALMKPTSILVNIGRGAVVDEAALYDALLHRRIQAAGLDVFAEEPTRSPLLKLPNVFATPHMAGTAVETQQGQITRSIDAIGDYLQRRRPRGLFNPEVLKSPRLRADWLRAS